LRSEVDAGLVRVDMVLKKMEGDGPGQVKKKKSLDLKVKAQENVQT
jgi:hypothetical protein